MTRSRSLALLKTARAFARSRGFESHTLRLTRPSPGSGKINNHAGDHLGAERTQNGRTP